MAAIENTLSIAAEVEDGQNGQGLFCQIPIMSLYFSCPKKQWIKLIASKQLADFGFVVAELKRTKNMFIDICTHVTYALTHVYIKNK